MNEIVADVLRSRLTRMHRSDESNELANTAYVSNDDLVTVVAQLHLSSKILEERQRLHVCY